MYDIISKFDSQYFEKPIYMHNFSAIIVKQQAYEKS